MAKNVREKKAMSNGLQGQISYTPGKCTDLSLLPVTGDTFLNSIAVPLLSVRAARSSACDFDIRPKCFFRVCL